MDGTLLNRQKEVTPKNREAIASFTAQGGKFVIATGRSVPATMPYWEALGLQLPCILYNGAAIYDFADHRFLWNAALPHSARAYMKEILDTFPQVGAEVLYQDRVYVARMNAHVAKHLEVEFLGYEEIPIDEIPDGWLKVLFIMDASIQPQVRAYANERHWQDVHFITSDAIYLEMMPLGVSKGDAMLRLAEMLSVPAARTVGIGDYNNDMELIQKAALGFAVSNAPEEVRQIADVIAPDCDQDAVSWALQYSQNYFQTVSK